MAWLPFIALFIAISGVVIAGVSLLWRILETHFGDLNNRVDRINDRLDKHLEGHPH